jgi:glycerol-3-phosphate dehydrogenase
VTDPISGNAQAMLGPEQRARAWQRLGSEQFDVVVIGGGVVGVGAALDAATRGLKVALVEARDFASGTSSRSSKMFHGGLRYLEQLEFGLVREALHERELSLTTLRHSWSNGALPVPADQACGGAPLCGEPASSSTPARWREIGSGAETSAQAGARLAPAEARFADRRNPYYDTVVDDARIHDRRPHGSRTRGGGEHLTQVVALLREGDRVTGAVRDSRTDRSPGARPRRVNRHGWGPTRSRLVQAAGSFGSEPPRRAHRGARDRMSARWRSSCATRRRADRHPWGTH